MTVACEDDCDGVHANIEYTVAKETGLVRVKDGEWSEGLYCNMLFHEYDNKWLFSQFASS